MDMDNQRKKNMGRKKIEIKKVEKESQKQVTFSKRRKGLFRKASELCVLCDVHAAIIVFSPGDKLFCFGQPDTNTVLNSYIKGTNEFEDKVAENFLTYQDYNRQYEEAQKMLEMEKKKLEDVQNLAKIFNKGGDWWNDSIDDMSSDQLEQFMVSIYELRRKLVERADELVMKQNAMP